MDSFMSWVGGKKALRDAIIDRFPLYYERYIEVFGGAGSGEIIVGSNGMMDVTANDMFEAASVKGTIDTIPEVPGLAVWQNGHIGIYIGNGEVIEAMGTQYGVVKTRLPDNWTHWLQIPYIAYIE